MKHLLWACLLLTACSTGSPPISISCGQNVVNSPGIDATPSLQTCFNSGDIINLAPGIYNIEGVLHLNRPHHQVIQTVNVTSGPPCLEDGAQSCAVLQANQHNKGPAIISGEGVSVTFNYIALDGNKADRRLFYKNTDWVNGQAYNASILDCSNCSFNGFASVNAAQGTGLAFSGFNAVFENDSFRNNGYGKPNYTTDNAWSDGLTIGAVPNLIIRNSLFINNSDVDLVMGSTPNAIIENNTIGNTDNFAFAGFMMNTFAPSSVKDFTGAQIRNNNVTCLNGACGIGIMIGPNFWDKTLPPITNGAVYNNSVQGAIFGIMIDGAVGTQVYGNTVSNWSEYSSYGCVSAAISSTIEDSNIYNNSGELMIGNYALCGPDTLPIMTLEE